MLQLVFFVRWFSIAEEQDWDNAKAICSSLETFLEPRFSGRLKTVSQGGFDVLTLIFATKNPF